MLCDVPWFWGHAGAPVLRWWEARGNGADPYLPRLWLVEIPSNSSFLTLQNISFSRQTQESGIKESLSWGTQRTQDALYEARAPLERGHSAEIPVGQPGSMVSPLWRGCVR